MERDLDSGSSLYIFTPPPPSPHPSTPPSLPPSPRLPLLPRRHRRRRRRELTLEDWLPKSVFTFRRLTVTGQINGADPRRLSSVRSKYGSGVKLGAACSWLVICLPSSLMLLLPFFYYCHERQNAAA